MKNENTPAMPIGLTVSPMGDVYDADFSETGLTKREQFCLKMGVAETGDKDLDDIIRKGNKQKLAAIAMQGLIASDTPEWAGTPESQAENAVKYADELLKELDK